MVAHASTSWLSGGFCQLPVLRPALTNQSLGPRHSRPYRPCVPTYRHEPTAIAASAAPSIPYVCTRPYRAPELFYGAECYRGEPDGTRARARVRACLCFHPSIHPSVRAASVCSSARACVWTCAARRLGAYTTPPPPCPSPRAVWSLGCLLCDVLLRCSMRIAYQKGCHSWRRLGGATARDPSLGRKGLAWATLHTPAARQSVPYRLTAHRLGLRTIDAASSSSMPRGSTATRCCAKKRRAPRAPRSSTCCTAASAHQRSRWAYFALHVDLHVPFTCRPCVCVRALCSVYFTLCRACAHSACAHSACAYRACAYRARDLYTYLFDCLLLTITTNRAGHRRHEPCATH